MTNQEVFDFGYTAIYNQGTPSYDEETDLCYYRHPDGILKCVAGHFIPDSDHKPEMEGLVVLPDPNDILEPIVRKFFESKCFNLELMSAMQNAHDLAAVSPGRFLDNWKHEMKQVAASFNLSTNVIKD